MDERLRFVAKLLDGESMTYVCREFGISRKTGYKIFARYKQSGLEALSDRSRRPVRYANQLPPQIEALVVTLKREKPHWGARKIRELLVRRLDQDLRIPAKSTIHAVLHRHGLVKGIGRPRSRASGTELSSGAAPNDLWCADFKGEFKLGNGHYCYPLTGSGRLVDRTHRYWPIMIAGYGLNLLSVPLLVLSGNWFAAAVLMVLERVGKAIRTPARDVMLSYATTRTGRGWGYGLHEAMDQTGATVGPLIVAGVLLLHGDYRIGFAVLLIPALVALSVLLLGRFLYPRPQDLEPAGTTVSTEGFSPAYWVYLAGACLVAAAYADYPLLAYHFERVGSVPKEWIALFYAVAMAVDGVAALLMGRWFDRRGIVVLAVATTLSALFAPLAFGGGFGLALAGAVLWGIGMGAQESIMRAAIVGLAPRQRRGTAFGLFNLLFGVLWFAGSALMGWLYDVSIPGLIAFSVLLQLAAIPFFLVSHRLRNSAR